MNVLRPYGFRATLALPLLLVGTLAACGGSPNPNHRAAILDVSTGDWQHISGAGKFANSVAWSPDSQSVVVIEGDDAVSRDAASGSEQWRVEGEEGSPVRDAAYSPGGETVALLRLHEALDSGAGTSVELVSAADGRPLGPGDSWSVSGETGSFTPMIHDLAWATDGRLGVIGLRGSTTDLFVLNPAADWSVTTEETALNETHVEAAPTGAIVAVTGHAGLVLYESGSEARVIPANITSGVLDLAFSPDGRRLALLENENLSIYDLDTETWTVRHEAFANSVAWGPGDTLNYSWGGTIFEIDAADGDPRVLLELDGDRTVRELEWSPDYTKLSFIVEPPYRD